MCVDRDALVAHTLGVAEALAGAGFGSRCVHAEPAQLLLAHGEVERELVVYVALDRPSSERDAKGASPAGAEAHVDDDVRRSATAIASAWRCHTGPSARKRARPAVVSL